MTIELRWMVSQSASSFHAAGASCRGLALLNPSLAEAIAEPARALSNEIRAFRLPEAPFWDHLAAMSAEIENDRELVEMALRKTIAAGAIMPTMVHGLAARVADVEAAVERVLPELVEEMADQADFLRDQWKARGNGLLGRIAELTDPNVLVPGATVMLVYPVLGGGGGAHLATNRVHVETVPSDPVEQLPEVVRLAWLLAQLNVDLPIFSDRIHRDRHPLIASLALLPPALAAGMPDEWEPCSRENIELALATWHVDGPAGVDLPEIVGTWWETYSASRPPWSVALAALDQMVRVGTGD
ncbi:MAG: hypothetical protein HQ581_05285 [Planctomycetes bacterium]|nr:hypothetical protein [Planctomycetota bacterium]